MNPITPHVGEIIEGQVERHRDANGNVVVEVVDLSWDRRNGGRVYRLAPGQALKTLRQGCPLNLGRHKVTEEST